MNRNGPSLQKIISPCRSVSEGYPRGKKKAASSVLALAGPAGLLTLVLAVSGCQPLTTPSRYPDLRSVGPPRAEGDALEQRRQIVRELIEDRDLARYKKAVVRHRSGISETPPPAAPAATTTRAEDVVRDAPKEAEAARVEEAESESDRAYRDRAQFDDGTLDDFIRRLKRDTDPVVQQDPPPDDEGPAAPSDDPEPQAWRLPARPAAVLAEAGWRQARPDQPALLLALAPPASGDDGAKAIRLAATGAEPSFFCSYLGWMVAWSTACLAEEEAIEAEQAEEQRAEAERAEAERQRADEDRARSAEDRARSAEDRARSADEPSADVDGVPADDQARVEGRRSSETPEQDADGDAAADGAIASEDIEDRASTAVSGALERLRNLLRSRTRPPDASSDDTASLSYEAEALRPRPDDGPPLPISRPEVAEDLRIVRNDTVFEFNRTPLPAFKPGPPEPKTVILPPETPRRIGVPLFIPEARPAPPAIADEGGPAAEFEAEVARSTGDAQDQVEPEPSGEPAPPAVIERPGPEQEPPLDSEVVQFEPGSARLPNGIEGRLDAMLQDARARDGKLFIVSEASIGSLAMERARGVGLALVRLGATADVIEYDIVVSSRADQVRILLKPRESSGQDENVADDPDQNG
jgi:hypothetical protein